MSMGLFTGLVTFYILFILMPATPSSTQQITHLTWVLVLQTLIYTSKPQLYGFPVFVVLAWVGWGVERRRILSAEAQKRM
jgi:hypothetical protein